MSQPTTSFAPTTELPSDDDVQRLPAVDVWGLNVYSQPGFFNRFTNWRTTAAGHPGEGGPPPSQLSKPYC